MSDIELDSQGNPLYYECSNCGHRTQTFEMRFWSKIKKKEGCWEWYGCITPDGYGQAYFDGKNKYAHRMAYELVKGPIPEGMVIDHLCFNRGCVNPDHLEPKTQMENTKRRNPARRLVQYHGTIYGYTHKKCRCPECVRVASERSKKNYRLRKDKLKENA